MGDRANIVFDMDSGPVFLYTHWSGSELPQTLAKALDSKEGRSRWSDESYLCRIVFNYLQGDNRGETGFGIASYQCDNDGYPYLVVKASALGKVTMIKEQTWGCTIDVIRHACETEALDEWSFAEFIAGVEHGRITNRFRGEDE